MIEVSTHSKEKDIPESTEPDNKKIIEIKNAGHWLQAENPKDFYIEVSDFLN